MAEYIDRSELLRIEKLLDTDILRKSKTASNIYDQMMYDITHIPAADDVAPVKHGEWEFPIFTDSDDGLDPRVKCSECGGIEAAFARWKYCPNCGAKMDGGKQHEDR